MTDSMATTAEEAAEREARAALTDSEKNLAKVLAAWLAWQGLLDGAGQAMGAVGETLRDHDALDGGDPTEYGAALLDRARKAGVL